MLDKKKKLGQVYTPEWIVDLILDKVGYAGPSVLKSYVFEPGSGSGNFLIPIVKRFINTAKSEKNSDAEIKKGLEKYIYAVEIDDEAYRVCIERLNKIANEHGITEVKWNIYNTDILDLKDYDLPKFDYVIGNPPYVRIHNIDKKRLAEIKSRFQFCKSGIIDLFLVFFEIGIKSLKHDGGKLGFITPNSFIHNSTYSDFRKYLAEHRLLTDLINFKENLVFQDASTYNAITILDTKNDSSLVNYYEYQGGTILHIDKIDIDKQDIKKWSLTNKQDSEFLDNIKTGKNLISDHAVVQYGFATLLDKAFVITPNSPLYGMTDRENPVIYPVIKASRYYGKEVVDKIIFPYHKKNNLWTVIPEDMLKRIQPEAYNHLLSYKKKLKNRSCDKSVQQWYEYGRSQGIQTIHNEKLVISPIFKEKINVHKAGAETMVYSGIFLFVKEGSKYTIDDLKKVLESKRFLRYAQIVGKDMRGGYKNINTKAIKDFKF